MKARFPDRVYTQARSLLGLPIGKSKDQLAGSLAKLPYNVAPDATRGAAQITTHTGDNLLAEELVVSKGLTVTCCCLHGSITLNYTIPNCDSAG